MSVMTAVLSFVILGASAENPPKDAASELLQRYLAVRSDHPNYGTNEAVEFWQAEAKKENISGLAWSVDPAGHCIHFVAHLPATHPQGLKPLALVHHADTMPVRFDEWKHPPFMPKWVRGQYDWELYGRGAIDDKGQGIVHWQTFRDFKNQPRNRDLFFIVNCGEEIGDAYGAKAFVHLLIKNLPNVTMELRAQDKVAVALMLSQFPTLSQLGWAWNEGSFGEVTSLKPWTLVPVATAQKGQWLGEVTIDGAGGHGALASAVSPLQAMAKVMTRFYERNHAFSNKFRSLHSEMAEMVKAVASTRSFFEKIILKIYPRAMFELMGMPSLVSNWWVPSRPQTESLLPNMVASKASMLLEYRFAGENTISEIENQVKDLVAKDVKSSLSFSIETREYNPFRRDFFEDKEAEVFKSVLESYPQTIVTPFITPGITDSRYFRQVGVKCFDLAPFFLSQENIRTMHAKNEYLPYQELMRGIEIETKVLRKLVGVDAR